MGSVSAISYKIFVDSSVSKYTYQLWLDAVKKNNGRTELSENELIFCKNRFVKGALADSVFL